MLQFRGHRVVVVRPVSGLDRPLVQWLLVAACAVVTILLATATRSAVRATSQLEVLAAAQQEWTAERQSLEAELARERATRQAFSLEVDRLRARRQAADASAAGTATLTLTPPASRGATPPEPTVAPPRRAQPIELRLLMPDPALDNFGDFQITARDWSTGQLRWARAGVPGATVDGRKVIVLYVTGEMFAPGAYELSVTPTSGGADASKAVASFEIGVRQEPVPR